MSLWGHPNIEKLKQQRKFNKLVKLATHRIDDIAIEATIAVIKLGDKSEIEKVAKSNDERVLSVFVKMLKDENGHYRKLAANYIEKMTWSPVEKERAFYYLEKEEWQSLRNIGIDCVDAILFSFQHNKEDYENKALETLIKIGNPVVKPLIQKLEETLKESKYKKEVCEKIIIALGEIENNDAVGPLINLIHRRDDIGIEAIRALGKIGDFRALEPLKLKYKDKLNIKEAYQTACAIARIGGEKGFDALCEGLESDDEIKQRASLENIGITKDERAIEYLAREVKNKDEILAKTVIEQLGEIGKPALNILIENYKNKNLCDIVKYKIAEILGYIGDEKAASLLIESLYSENSFLSEISAEALVKIKDPAVIEPIVRILFENKLQLGHNHCEELLLSVVSKSSITEQLVTLIIEAASNDNKISSKAVSELCRIENEITSNILYLVSNRKDYRFHISNQSCGGPTYIDYSFSHERNMAMDELKKRNFKEYNPSFYL